MGSVFLGIWLYGLMFSFDPVDGETQDVGRWFGWGMVGLVMAAAGYGIRALGGVPQLVSMILLGLLSTLVVMGAVLNENVYIFATLCSGIGAGLIVAAMPPPRVRDHAPGHFGESDQDQA